MSTTTATTAEISIPFAAIAAALPGGWTVKPCPHECIQNEPRGSLVRADGLEIWAHANGYSNRGKVTFRHSRPEHERRYLELWEMPENGGGKIDSPSINCGLTKSGEQMAQDITRRMLAECERVEKIARAKIAERDESDNAQLNTLCAIRKAAGFKDPSPEAGHSGQPRFTVDIRGDIDRRAGDTLRNGWGDAEINGGGGSVDFKLYSIPAHKAVALVEWMRANVFTK